MCARHVLLAAILLVCAPPNPSRGREVMVYVRDLGGCQSVIVARLTKVTAIPGGAARGETHVIELEPLATLAGVLDPSKTPSLTAGVDVEAFPGISSIHTAPAVGAYVLAVIWKVDAQQREVREGGNAFQRRGRVWNFSDGVLAIGQCNWVRAGINEHRNLPEPGLAGDREVIKQRAQGVGWIGDFTDLDIACVGTGYQY